MLIMSKMRPRRQYGLLVIWGQSICLYCRWHCLIMGACHGGANEAVLNMLNEIGNKKHIHEYIEKARDRDDPFRLFGFGHRVYKNFDPRAKVLRKACHDVLDKLGIRPAPS